MLFSDAGKVIRFNESAVRCMGRTARGVRGIRLEENQRVISLIVIRSGDSTILTSTEHGFGKRTLVSEFPTKGRGGQGVISIQTTERNGQVVGAVQVEDNDEIMLITDGGTLVRTRVDEISVVGRNTQGVTLIQLSNEEKLVGLQRIEEQAIDEATVEQTLNQPKRTITLEDNFDESADDEIEEDQNDLDSEAEDDDL
jgi:DNA gyrase subunit A